MVKFSPGTLGKISISSTRNNKSGFLRNGKHDIALLSFPFLPSLVTGNLHVLSALNGRDWSDSKRYEANETRRQLHGFLHPMNTDILRNSPGFVYWIKHPKNGIPGFMPHLDITCNHNLLPVVFKFFGLSWRPLLGLFVCLGWFFALLPHLRASIV